MKYFTIFIISFLSICIMSCTDDYDMVKCHFCEKVYDTSYINCIYCGGPQYHNCYEYNCGKSDKETKIEIEEITCDTTNIDYNNHNWWK